MKKAIIIGASSGIGRALAGILLKEGYLVGITGRREELLASIQEKNPDRIFFKKMDVQELSTCASACMELTHLMGGLDLLVISAGIGEVNEELTFEIENRVIETNILGFTCIADWAMRYFKGQGYGHLLNISSVAGIRGNGKAPSYHATKAFQINYLEGLRLNAKKNGSRITVTDVRPGYVDTAMAKGRGLFWVAPVQRAAEQIFFAIKKEKRVVYITKRWKIIAFLLQVIPFSLLRRL
jgi:short-subunit dehydrogenase